ncbi:MAG: redox-sensing transcriptional repressor Rex [Candidatus Sumerlaeaceae bacterium]
MSRTSDAKPTGGSGPAVPHEPLRSPDKLEQMARIPPAVVKRLSLYSRVLTDLEMGNVEKVSSQELAEYLGLNSAQVRKDLAYFGQFGVPGFGYYVSDLRVNLKRILRTDREVRVALIGVGNLGTALVSYAGFSRQGFKILMAFDADRRKVGSMRGNIELHHIDDLESRLAETPIDIAVLAVPTEACQTMADRLVEAGVTGILNFVPKRLNVPPQVKVHYVDLAIEMESLSYYLR